MLERKTRSTCNIPVSDAFVEIACRVGVEDLRCEEYGAPGSLFGDPRELSHQEASDPPVLIGGIDDERANFARGRRGAQKAVTFDPAFDLPDDALSIERETKVMVSPMLKMHHEGFGRQVLIAARRRY